MRILQQVSFSTIKKILICCLSGFVVIRNDRALQSLAYCQYAVHPFTGAVLYHAERSTQAGSVMKKSLIQLVQPAATTIVTVHRLTITCS